MTDIKQFGCKINIQNEIGHYSDIMNMWYLTLQQLNYSIPDIAESKKDSWAIASAIHVIVSSLHFLELQIAFPARCFFCFFPEVDHWGPLSCTYSGLWGALDNATNNLPCHCPFYGRRLSEIVNNKMSLSGLIVVQHYLLTGAKQIAISAVGVCLRKSKIHKNY